MFLSFSFTGYPRVGFGFVFIANIADLIFASRHGLHKRESTISQCSLRPPRRQGGVWHHNLGKADRDCRPLEETKKPLPFPVCDDHGHRRGVFLDGIAKRGVREGPDPRVIRPDMRLGEHGDTGILAIAERDGVQKASHG